ncbi:MAG: ROK family protein [Sedimentisphaeraceae bacterium JB056]
MKKEPADFKDIALQNEKLVIALLRRHGVMSQTQLRKLSGLSMSTSSYIIARLRNKGYILETKGESKKRGAKPVNLQIDPNGCFAIGIEIKTDSVLAGLFDFNANLIGEISEPATDTSPDSMAIIVKKCVEFLVEEYQQAQGKIAGVGIAISGSIRDDGVVVLSSPLGWKNVAFKHKLTEIIDLPVNVYTTEVRMLAEMDMEAPQTNMIYINIGNGVGGHVILDGNLCHGATGRIGEIGHVVVDPDGDICGCGNKGCLETLISGRAIAAKIKSDMSSGNYPELQGFVKKDDLPETVVSRWGSRLESGCKYSEQLASEISASLSDVVCMMVNICDPEIITLAGYVSDSCFGYLKTSLLEAFKTKVYNYSERKFAVVKAKAGIHALIKGAAISVLK